MKKALLFLLAFCSVAVLGQNTRVDPYPTSTVAGNPLPGMNYPPILAIPNALISVCSYPANGLPCTNTVTTYTDPSPGAPCPPNAQVVLQGGNTCQNSSDPSGNFGFWLPPGDYSYTITVPETGQTYGPFALSAGNSSSSAVSPVVYANECATPPVPSWCSGSDWAAWVNAADIYLGASPGTIIYEPSGPATLVAATQPVLSHANRTLYLRTGNYQLNKAGRPGGALLIEASSVTVKGDGPGKSVVFMGPASEDDVIRTYSGTYPGGTASLYDISIHDLELSGNCPGTTKGPDDTYQNGINLNNVNRTKVYNNYVHDVCYQGIIFDAAGLVFTGNETVNTNGTSVTCVGCFGLNSFDITPNGWNGRPVLINGVYYAISSVSSGTNLTLTTSAGVQNGVNAQFWVGYGNSGHDNLVRTFGEVGIGLEVAQNEAQIVNNTIEDGVGTGNPVGIFLGGYANSTYLDVSRPLISGNTIRNLPGTGVGIALFDRTSYPLISNNVLDVMGNCIASTEVTHDSPFVSIKNNSCSNTSGNGILVSAINPTIAGTYDIVNNKVFNAGSSGILVQNLANAVVQENQVVGAVQNGLFLVADSNTVLTSNTVLNSLNFGIQINAGNTNTFVSGNTMLNNSSTINDLGTNSLIGINNTGSPTPTLGSLVVQNSLAVQNTFSVHNPIFFEATILIASGFGTSPIIFSPVGSATFTIGVGSGGTASSGVITLPTAVDGWNCSATDTTTTSTSVFMTKQTAQSVNSVTLTNFNSSGTASPWTAGDLLTITCTAY